MRFCIKLREDVIKKLKEICRVGRKLVKRYLQDREREGSPCMMIDFMHVACALALYQLSTPYTDQCESLFKRIGVKPLYNEGDLGHCSRVKFSSPDQQCRTLAAECTTTNYYVGTLPAYSTTIKAVYYS